MGSLDMADPDVHFYRSPGVSYAMAMAGTATTANGISIGVREGAMAVAGIFILCGLVILGEGMALLRPCATLSSDSMVLRFSPIRRAVVVPWSAVETIERDIVRRWTVRVMGGRSLPIWVGLIAKRDRDFFGAELARRTSAAAEHQPRGRHHEHRDAT